MLDPVLEPPQTKGHVSVAKLARFWYVACRSEDLSRAPLARTVLGLPLVLYRGDGGRPSALLDRCPHRNVPLSLGRVLPNGRLECAYHGWQFDGAGVCRAIPGLAGETNGKDRRVPSCAVREQQGMIWVFPSLDAEAEGAPFELPLHDDPAYTTVVREVSTGGTLHATVENALDVPHTAFLHRGLFRGGRRNEIRAIVKRFPDRVETEYLGEPRPSGIAGKVISPSGGTVEHWDRFILPSIAQVEYRLGEETHFLITSLCTPVTDFETRMFAVVQFRTHLPARLVRPVLEPFALRIFGQDAAMLRAQTENIRRFGGEQYMSTELDFMGPHIWRLLKQAEQGVRATETVVEREVRFYA